MFDGESKLTTCLQGCIFQLGYATAKTESYYVNADDTNWV